MSEEKIYREINRYIDGKLSEKEIESLWEIFVENPEYYEWFETELHLRDLAKEANQKNITTITSLNGKPEGGTRRYSKTWIFAVAAAILIGIGFQFYFIQDSGSFHPYSMNQIEIDEMSGTDILRSDESTVSKIDVEISRALSLAYEGELNDAISKFNSLLLQNPEPGQEANIMMNLGILHYNMRNFEEAKDYFETASESDVMNKFFREKAWWFLGNAYLNLEMLEEARETVYQVYIAEGRFESSAERLLQSLDQELEDITE